MNAPRHVLFTGGGSAGHVVPSLPLIAHFAAAGSKISYVGSAEGPERGLVAPLGVPFFAIRSGKLRRYWSWRNVADVWWIFVGVLQAIVLIGRLRPSIVFSKGGYAAFPVVVGAWIWRVPIVAHESDLTPGLANRLSLPFVAAVCTTFALTEFPVRNRPVIHTGTPLRAELLQWRRGARSSVVRNDRRSPLGDRVWRQSWRGKFESGGARSVGSSSRIRDRRSRLRAQTHGPGDGGSSRLPPVRVRRQRLGRHARRGRRRRQSRRSKLVVRAGCAA